MENINVNYLAVGAAVVLGAATYYYVSKAGSVTRDRGTGTATTGGHDDIPIRIQKLMIYPIKSCAALEVTHCVFDGYGIVNDRRFMLIHNGRFMSQRTTPEMVLIKPVISEDGKTLVVNAPGMPELCVPLNSSDYDKPSEQAGIFKDTVNVVTCGEEAQKWFSEYFKKEVKLVKLPNEHYQRPVAHEYTKNLEDADPKYDFGFQDGSQVNFLSQASIDELNKRISKTRMEKGEGERPEMTWKNFRPNVLLTGNAFQEDTWRLFRIGDSEFKTVDHTGRCKLTTVNPVTGILDQFADEEPLRTLRIFRKIDSSSPLLSIQAVQNSPGSQINVGDIVDVVQNNFKSKNHQTPK